MKKLSFFLFLGLIFSCTSDDPAEICCTIIDTGIDIKITDATGEPILDGNTESSFVAFDKVEGNWERSRSQRFIVVREN